MCQLCAPTISSKEEFSGKLVEMMNHAGLALMVSIGHRTGLFDVMNGLPPATIPEIATAAGLNERYVREWLGAMTMGRIVHCDPDGPRFHLPPEHAASLIRQAGADNIAVLAQYFAVLGTVEDQVVDCFHRGGGVPYSAFPRFHAVMAEDSGQSVLSTLLDTVLPIIPGIQEALEAGIEVLDVGCGSGRALNLMARHFPNSQFLGLDLSREAITSAQAEARKNGLRNANFEVRDLSDFEIRSPRDQFHLITAFDAIHDQARPDRVLTGIARALRKDGTFLMQDIAGSSEIHRNFDRPLAPLLYTISTMHCMTVSLAQGGVGLGAMWGREKAVAMLEEAGFTRVEIQELPHDIQNSYYLARLN